MSLFNKAMNLTLAAGLLAASVSIAAEDRVYKGYETPPYRIVHSDGAVELRRYDTHLLAEVSVEGSRQGAVGRGFRVLAGYIFGKNAEGKKVSMTAPVSQVAHDADPSGSNMWDVRFMMPSGYAPGTLPKPDDASIRIIRSEPQLQAVIRFSGFWTDRKLTQKSRQLRDWLDANGLTPSGPPHYYFYDDPFTLPFNRRNEVAFVID